jgi:hypothetical protein
LRSGLSLHLLPVLRGFPACYALACLRRVGALRRLDFGVEGSLQ